MDVTILPAEKGLSGQVSIPPSKSHTIRAVLISSLAEGDSRIEKPLLSDDTLSCAAACRALGAKITDVKGTFLVNGTAGQIMVPEDIIDTGNSGTTLYLTAATAALADGYSVFTGDHQIRSRPIGGLLEALKDLGADAFTTRDNGCAPFVIKGPLRGGKTTIECPTSQYLSSLLISLPLAKGNSVIKVPLLNEAPYVTMTLDWLAKNGIEIEYEEDYSTFKIPGGQNYKAINGPIAADFSSATFFFCAAAITQSRLLLTGLDMKDTQGDKIIAQMIQALGCSVTETSEGLLVEGRPMKGCELDLNSCPDALPALAVTACYAEGTTILANVPQARLKETDRISVMCQELSALGAKIEEREDGLVIHGGPLCGGTVNGHSDHRVVMALSIAALGAQAPVTISTSQSVQITFPNFFELLESIRVK